MLSLFFNFCGNVCKVQNIFTSNIFKKIFFNVLFIFERESKQVREREREGDTELKMGSRLHAVSTEPDGGLELTNCEIMT